MAEPLAIIGAVAAVSQVTGDLVKLTTHLRHYLKVIRSAPEEVQAFVIETSNFTGLLNFFTELAEHPVKDIERREQKKRDKRISRVEDQCAYVRGKMEYLVDRFAGLANGNLTALESLVERIKYLLDKPDIKDLRLSVQSATITINTMSTLFLWEEAKNDSRRLSLLEQLKNLLPMGKKASADLAAHQQRHGIRYESAMPDPNNAILAASREIQRQVSHIIRLQSRFEADVNEGWGQNPSDSSEHTSLSRPWSSPPGSGGAAVESTRHVPQQKANRVSFKNSTHSRRSHLGDDGVGASQRGVIIKSYNPFSSPPADSANNQSKQVPSRTSSEDNEPIELNSPVRKERSDESHSGYWAVDTSDPMKPRFHQCRECSIEHCKSCHRSHCIRDYCLLSEDLELVENKTLDSNAPGDSNPLSEPRRAISNEGSHQEGIRSSYEEQIRHSPPTDIHEEISDLSDAELDPVMGRWSHTDALPSSKSSSPSEESPRSADSKERNPTIIRPAESEIQEAPDLVRKVSEVYKERPGLQTEQEQSRHLDSALEIRPLETRNKEVNEKRSRESGSALYRSHLSNDGSESSEHDRPSPCVPMAPFGGPGGRRRPRRPHLRQRGE
ncbi:hypothetical protein FHL15_003301 [Xylaria flabelliformis]|uniref:Fungal N-terminal domain-containing protein n=1 Tax=Xylaria flabelliformis TaxID=2512241 RepID=A0A553I6B3_9PEZI|nr:hypothetical protein FHL15_003301 [Xylaria flabelliformis]